jgi:hypothetical protein
MAITLVNTQAALVASELALSLVLQAHVSPSITSSANISAVTATTSSPPSRIYCWNHGITTNIAHTSVICYNLVSALNNPTPASPICLLTTSQRKQLHQLADILMQHTANTPPQHSDEPTPPYPTGTQQQSSPQLSPPH